MRQVLPWTSLALAALLIVAGCGGSSDGLPRQAIYGEVTLDGQPVASGRITFVPIGFDGPPIGGAIQSGSYSIAAQQGAIPGSHRVAIYRQMPTGKTTKDLDDPTLSIEEQFETIPARYNSKSELKADVTKGGSNHFPFELTGEIKTPPPPRRRPADVDPGVTEIRWPLQVTVAPPRSSFLFQ